MLREEFLSPMDIGPQELAKSIRVPEESITEIITNQKASRPASLCASQSISACPLTFG
jgi:plasmid maintenance system antidote protein VapI